MDITKKVEIGGKIYVLKKLTGADVARIMSKCGRLNSRGELDFDVGKFLNGLLRATLKNATLEEIQQAPANVYFTLLNEITPQMIGMAEKLPEPHEAPPREKEKSRSDEERMFV
jgi:hypothetical protein